MASHFLVFTQPNTSELRHCNKIINAIQGNSSNAHLMSFAFLVCKIAKFQRNFASLDAKMITYLWGLVQQSHMLKKKVLNSCIIVTFKDDDDGDDDDGDEDDVDQDGARRRVKPWRAFCQTRVQL